MTFVLAAGKGNTLLFDGKDACTRDATKAKVYATEAAAKRGIKKAEEATGRNGFSVIAQSAVGKAQAPAATKKKPARKSNMKKAA